MDNIDLDIDNYTQKELQRFLKLKDNYSNDELNSQISKFTLKIVDNSYPKEYKEELIFFINSVKDRLKIESKKDYNKDTNNDINNFTNYTKVLSNIIDTKIGNIIKTHNNYNHNPLQSQRLSLSTINSYNEKTISENYVFNTRFRNNFLNSIPQESVFHLPESINNVVKISLSCLQVPNVMLAFSNAKFTTQIYIREDTTNYQAIVVIPEGNYDELTFPGVLTKAINEQVINPFILPANYRFNVVIDPYTFLVTISNTTYTFTMETITKYPSKLGYCTLNNQLNSSNPITNQTYDETITFQSTQDASFSSDTYNSRNVVSDLHIEENVFNVKYVYNSVTFTDENLVQTEYEMKTIMKGNLILDLNVAAYLDMKFEYLNTSVLYVELYTKVITGGNSLVSADTIEISGSEKYFKHVVLLNADLLNVKTEEQYKLSYSIPPDSINNFTKTGIDATNKIITGKGGIDTTLITSLNPQPFLTSLKTVTSRYHNYILKIYKDKSFELRQSILGSKFVASSTYGQTFLVYDDVSLWKNHNRDNVNIRYNPTSQKIPYYKRSRDVVTDDVTTTYTDYIQEYMLYQMMTGDIFIAHNSSQKTTLNMQITMTHYPYTPLYTFPQITSKLKNIATTLSSISNTNNNNAEIVKSDLTCKEKISANLSETYNFRLNDIDIKNNVSETSISNTLGYQIGYRSIQYTGLKSYTSESAFDKTSLDYIYFCLDDYNNGYLNHNFGVLPGENILDKNILAIIPITSPQFSTTFDNGADYIPKLRHYSTPVDIKKIKIKLLDPMGNILDINTNDFSFVIEVTKLLDITGDK